MQEFGVVLGSTCFGGCYDCCCDTPFYNSTTAGVYGIVETRKKQQEGCARLVARVLDHLPAYCQRTFTEKPHPGCGRP